MFNGPRCFIAFVALALCATVHPLIASNNPEIFWRANKTVDARVASCPIDKVLARIAGLSGWTILMEPGLEESVSVEFKNVSQGEALKLLLGQVNYVLVPEKNGKLKLLVYKNSVGAA